MNHPNCPKTKAAVINGEYVEGCSQCLSTITHSADGAAAFKRRSMMVDNRKDITQRYAGDKLNPEWVKLYPAKAREEFGDAYIEEFLRKH